MRFLVAIFACSQIHTVSAQPTTCSGSRFGISERTPIDCSVLAEKGDANAQYFMGAYFRSKGDVETALKWFSLSALQGDLDAIEVVRVTLFGRAHNTQHWTKNQVDPPSAEMVEFLRKVVKIPSLDNRTLFVTQAQICQAYSEGIGVQVDYKSAVYWCEQSVKNGGSTAAWELIKFHKHGMGVPRSAQRAEALWQEFLALQVLPLADDNPEVIVQWYQRGARIGLCSASIRLTEIYKSGLYKVSPSIERANAWRQHSEYCKAME